MMALEKTILKSLHEYIMNCPSLKKFNDVIKVYVEFSNDEEKTTYTLEEGVTSNSIITKYTNGDTRRQFLFTFSSVECFGSDFDINMDNSGFYEEFTKWLEDNTKNKIVPKMNEDKQALKVEALTNGYLFNNSADGTTGRYMIQCKLTYFQKY